MMKKLLLAFALLVFSGYCHTLTVSLNQDSVTADEEIIATASVTNTGTASVNFLLQATFLSPDPTSAARPSIEYLTLAAGETKSVTFSMAISEFTSPGIYGVAIELADENGESAAVETKNFTVYGTLSPITSSMQSCSDAGCSKTESVFVVGETNYVKITADVQDLTVSGTLTKPDGTTEPVSFTNYAAQIPVAKAGSYMLTVTLSKEGYADSELALTFSGIAENADIPISDSCNENAVCEAPGETTETCPQDCPPPMPFRLPIPLEYIAIGFVAAVVAIAAMKLRKPKQVEPTVVPRQQVPKAKK